MSATIESTATGYRYLVKTPGICAGNARVDGTRIPVNTVVIGVIRGDSLEEIIKDYPALTRAQIYECMAYYEDHREEIDPLIKINSDLFD